MTGIALGLSSASPHKSSRNSAWQVNGRACAQSPQSPVRSILLRSSYAGPVRKLRAGHRAWAVGRGELETIGKEANHCWLDWMRALLHSIERRGGLEWIGEKEGLVKTLILLVLIHALNL